MNRFLITFLLTAIPFVATFPQETADSIGDGKQSATFIPGTPGNATYSTIMQPEMPGAMQNNFSETISRKHPYLKKTPEVPDFKINDRWTWTKVTPDNAASESNPYAYDYKRGGVITSWDNGMLMGSGRGTTLPGMMSTRNATFTAVQNIGNFTLTAGVSANRYLLTRDSRTMFGVSGSMNYRFNDNLSFTLFGRYYNNNSFYTMGAMPYFGTSGYGGYFTFQGETVGMDLGAERYYDNFARRWVTSPIITPKIKFSEKFTLELPVGWLVKEVIDDVLFDKNKKSGPIIMPTGMPSVGPIPFGTPETPH